jgi:hypothetical protein
MSCAGILVARYDEKFSDEKFGDLSLQEHGGTT